MQLNPMDYNNRTKMVKWFGHIHRLPEDSPAKQAYKEVAEKPTKKIKGGQKLTWHHIITRDLNTIDIDLQKAVKLIKNQRLI